MCQLLGVVGKTQTDLTELLFTFSQGSRVYKHGWGLANLLPYSVQIVKSPEQAARSPLFAETLARRFTAQNAFAHLRYATVGGVEAVNVHPFEARDNAGREWVLMHQGTLFSFDAADGYMNTQSGSTDSERILLFLVDKINAAEKEQGHSLNAARRFDVLDTQIREMAHGNKLNLAIYDGEQVYLHSNYANSLYVSRGNDALLFCSVPLTTGDIWETLPLNTLFALKDGGFTCQGTPHSNIYIDTEEDIRQLHEIYANLEQEGGQYK